MKKDKEWLLRELKKIHHEFQGGYLKVKAIDVLRLIDRLDEPEKVIIPQFVADWWERDSDSVTIYGELDVDKKHKLDLVSEFHDRGLCDHLSKLEVWIDENNSIFLDLVNGKPYEIEKEKLYYIPLGVKRAGQSPIYLLKSSKGIDIDWSPIRHIESEKYAHSYQFTESEIKSIIPNYWPFAEPVETTP